MVRVELTAEEAEDFRAIMESYLSDLRMEIVDTDGDDFRKMLKKRKNLVGKLLKQLVEQIKAAGS